MDRPRRFLLHVGLPKTGTSYLQSILWASRPALERAGVALVPGRQVDHFWTALAVRGLVRDFDDPAARTVLDRLSEDLERATCDQALLSQEALAPTTPAQAPALLQRLDGWEVHVVVTARDLARQLPSAWQQRIKSRHTYTWPEFVAGVRDRAPLAEDLWINQDLGQVLDHWTSVVPAERVHLVTVPPSGSPPGLLLERFCSVLGVDPGTLAAPEPDANASIGHHQAELLRRVNLALGDRLPSPREGYTPVGRTYLAETVLARQHGAPVRLPASAASWCDQLAESWAARARELGVAVVGDLADLRPAATAYADGEGPPEPAASDLLDAATAALADVLDLRAVELAERRAADAEREAPAHRPLWRRAAGRVRGSVRRGQR